MITINSTINSLTELSVAITTEVGNFITSVVVWRPATYSNVNDAVDISDMIVGTSETESLTVTPEDIGETSFSGIYIIQVTSDEALNNTRTIIVGNISLYYECLLRKTLSLQIDGCNQIITDDCSNCHENTLLTSVFINSMIKAVELQNMNAVIRFAKDLDNLCEFCETCPSPTENTLITSIATINNEFYYGNIPN
jgi:hypothetical protein